MHDIERVPPHNIEAEIGVLGSILIAAHIQDRDLVPQANLLPSDFYSTAHRDVFEAMAELSLAGHTPTPALLASKLSDPTVIPALTAPIRSPSGLDAFANEVRTASQRRSLISLYQTATQAAFKNGQPPSALISSAQASLTTLLDQSAPSEAPKTWTAPEMEADPESDTEWLISHILARGELTLLQAPMKEGKSFLLFGLLKSLSHSHFCGLATKPATVLFFTEENKGTILEKHNASFGIQSPISYVWARERTKFQSLEQVLDFARRNPHDIVIFDTLAEWGFIPPKGENDPDVMNQIMRAFRHLAVDTRSAVLVTHHARKDPTGDVRFDSRGSGAITAVPESLLTVRIPSGSTWSSAVRGLHFQGRHTNTPDLLLVEYNAKTREFHKAMDPHLAAKRKVSGDVMGALRDLARTDPTKRYGRDRILERLKELEQGVSVTRLDEALRWLSRDDGPVSYVKNQGYKLVPEPSLPS